MISGVPFDLIDKRDVKFSNESNPVFKSKGYRLGSGTEILQSQDSPTTSHSTQTADTADRIESQLLENPLTIQQFLNKLPASVVKNGKMIDIRNDLSQLITVTMVTKKSFPKRTHQIL